MKKQIFTIILLAAGNIMAASNMFPNSPFKQSYPAAEHVKTAFKKSGFVEIPEKLPRFWRIGPGYGSKNPGGKITVSVAENNVLVFQMDVRSAMLYCGNYRMDAEKMRGKTFEISLSALGKGSFRPMFHGYTAENKCVTFKQFPAVVIPQEGAYGKTAIKFDLPENIKSLDIGFIISGKVSVSGAELREISPEESAILYPEKK